MMAKGLQVAIILLASRFENGELMADTFPADFVDMVTQEIDDIRAENADLRRKLAEAEAVIKSGGGKVLIDENQETVKGCFETMTFVKKEKP